MLFLTAESSEVSTERTIEFAKFYISTANFELIPYSSNISLYTTGRGRFQQIKTFLWVVLLFWNKHLTLTCIHQRNSRVYRYYFDEQTVDSAIHKRRDMIQRYSKIFNVLSFMGFKIGLRFSSFMIFQSSSNTRGLKQSAVVVDCFTILLLI